MGFVCIKLLFIQKNKIQTLTIFTHKNIELNS